MKVKSISRFFSMKKVTLSFVTVFIGVGTIGSFNQYADASTKTQQTHVTKTSPTQKTTSNFKRSVKDTVVKSRATSTKRAISPKTSSTKNYNSQKSTTLNKTRTTTKTQPTIRKSSTTSTRSKTMPTSVKRTTSHKATTVSPTSKAKISTKHNNQLKVIQLQLKTLHNLVKQNHRQYQQNLKQFNPLRQRHNLL